MSGSCGTVATTWGRENYQLVNIFLLGCQSRPKGASATESEFDS